MRVRRNKYGSIGPCYSVSQLSQAASIIVDDVGLVGIPLECEDLSSWLATVYCVGCVDE